jgi:hypothetical protein
MPNLLQSLACSAASFTAAYLKSGSDLEIEKTLSDTDKKSIEACDAGLKKFNLIVNRHSELQAKVQETHLNERYSSKSSSSEKSPVHSVLSSAL